MSELKDDRILAEGVLRNTTKPGSKRPKSKEEALYIEKSLDVYRTIIINIHDRIEENISNIGMATRHEEAVRSLIKVDKDKLRLNNKGSWTTDDAESLNNKFENMKKFKGHDKSFYEMERDKYMDYIEEFVSSAYTANIIDEFGFDAVFGIGIVGTLDLWYKNTLVEMALNKKLITEDEAQAMEF